MMDPVRELKVRAELLHRRVQASEEGALTRVRALPEHRKADVAALRAVAASIQRKHCLAIVSREAGFAGWEHARRVLDGDAVEVDFGKLLCVSGRGTYLNHWFATYEEAHAVHADLLVAGQRRYLLAYQRQLFIAESGYIESIGLEPDDADWRAMGWDWARPRSYAARRRLYGKLLAPRRDVAA
jgi:hypothetical protein